MYSVMIRSETYSNMKSSFSIRNIIWASMAWLCKKTSISHFSDSVSTNLSELWIKTQQSCLVWRKHGPKCVILVTNQVHGGLTTLICLHDSLSFRVVKETASSPVLCFVHSHASVPLVCVFLHACWQWAHCLEPNSPSLSQFSLLWLVQPNLACLVCPFLMKEIKSLGHPAIN